ncbi:MAG: YbaK/EbsC family protein [Lachnospiraceae bacterium]|nr:YbaK/EbsC family protein [Lachnospiraceae bacterium]
MSIEAVREHLKRWDAQDRILEFPVSSATVELAAQAVGCEPARIAKTLSFLIKTPPQMCPETGRSTEEKGALRPDGAVDGHAVLIVAAGDAKVDNAKYRNYFHTKAKMLHGDQVAEMVGHAIGGVCPFGVKEGTEIYLDESLKRFRTVFPAAGSSNSAIEVTMEELERFSGSRMWVDVCKGWQDGSGS